MKFELSGESEKVKIFNSIPAGINLNRQNNSVTVSIEIRVMFMEEQIEAALFTEP